MRVADFVTTTFGTARLDAPSGLHWFDPAPLPRELSLEPETQIALSRADGALGRLDGIARLLQNPDLIATPYASREAVASSRIEGTHATLAEVYETEAGKARAYEEDVRAIEAYTAALVLGLDAVRRQPFQLDMLKAVHARLLADGPHSKYAGSWRREIVWVGSSTGGPETATFVPPISARLPELLAEWSEWHLSPPRIPLLVRVALLHYQFLTIHPFVDGNGRVGRMLIQMILEEERALSAPLLYVSAYFARNRREYYDRLQAVRQRGEIQEWLQYFLTAVAVQANDGVTRAKRLLDLREEYRAGLSGSRSRAGEVVDMLFVNPVISAGRVQQHLDVSNQGALNLVRSLEKRGWLSSVGQYGRGGTNFWCAPQILGLFDDESDVSNSILR